MVVLQTRVSAARESHFGAQINRGTLFLKDLEQVLLEQLLHLRSQLLLIFDGLAASFEKIFREWLDPVAWAVDFSAKVFRSDPGLDPLPDIQIHISIRLLCPVSLLFRVYLVQPQLASMLRRADPPRLLPRAMTAPGLLRAIVKQLLGRR